MGTVNGRLSASLNWTSRTRDGLLCNLTYQLAKPTRSRLFSITPIFHKFSWERLYYLSSLSGPDGYVSNFDDCDDTDASIWLGAYCQDPASTCEGVIDSTCNCALLDADNDGVCDSLDQCSGQDDTVDKNGDGVADCLLNQP